jgi:hypothetical protein
MPDRARDLLGFLDGWLDDVNPVHVRLRDALRYEDAIARLGPWHTATNVDDGVNLPDVPKLRGTVQLHEFGCDPRVLAGALHASAPDLGSVPDEPHALCFWRAPDADEVTVLDLDALGFHLLARLDGRRNVPALVRSLGGGRGATAAVRAALSTLAEFGLVQLPAMPEARCA